jgi:hypothetical protein
MSARLLAIICSLLSVGLSNGRAEPVLSASRELVVYLNAGQSDRTLPYMQHELATLMQTAGYRVAWEGPGDSPDTESAIAVVQLRGDCRAPSPHDAVKPVEPGASLASTAVDGDRVLPFSWINCDTLTQMLAPSLATVQPGRKDFLYGRAMGRLLAHELYHMLVNKRGHETSGIGKASFSAKDVLGESFTFEESTLAEFRDTEPAATEDEEAGR